MKQNFLSSDGFTYTELIIGVSVFFIIALGIYDAYFRIRALVETARAETVGSTVANDDIELFRNVPYTNVGVVGSIPNGIFPQTATTTRGGFTFSITRTVRNVDDPFDGVIGGIPNDTAPADYKQVEIQVVCSSCANSKIIRKTTTVAPKSLELTSGGGALFIQVFNASGVPVPQATVAVTNASVTPSLVINDVTNSSGILQLVDVPASVNGYNVSVTKDGYSLDRTYPPGGGQNPNPLKPNATVSAGQVTQISFFIDQTSTIQLSTKNQLCAVVSNPSLQISGAKLIGTPNVLKYSKATTTNASGNRTIQSLEWDTYNFSITDLSYDLAGSIPLLPINLSPNSTQNVQLLLEAKNPKSLLVNIKDSANGQPVTGAVVELTRGVFSTEATTGEGHIIQTDWSGGSGQASYVNQTRFFASDGNIDVSAPVGEIKLRSILGSYQPSGWLESSTFDSGISSNFQNIFWFPQDQPPAAGADSVKFQVATNNDNTTWNFIGPDGTNGSYYTLTNTNLSALHSNKQYFRYRVFLSTADSTKTPNVSDIGFTFVSSCIPPGQVFFSSLSSGTYTLTVTHPNYQVWSNTDISINSDYQIQDVLLAP